VTAHGLSSAIPSDRVHLISWQTYDELDVRLFCVKQNAEFLSYRDNLLQRTSGEDRFLALDLYVDREITALRTMCDMSTSGIVVIHGMDILVAYLQARSGKVYNLFWDRLLRLRHLTALLWIVLPPSFIPTRWPVDRVLTFQQVAARGIF
jgi:hypothetical protein